LNEAAAEATAKEITDKHGLGIGVAGQRDFRVRPGGRPRREHHRPRQHPRGLEQARARLWRHRLDCVTAGIFVPPDTAGTYPDDKWALTFAINVTAAISSPTKRAPTWKEQGLRGSLVLTTSANAVVAKKGSVAYDTSKAAANHLVRELAVELSPLVRVNGVAPGHGRPGQRDVPARPRHRSLAKYKIPYKDDEATEAS
jgi:NAD(P)-dependent dehydrogenase (short-subunit alcohol dehydrogenase family)